MNYPNVTRNHPKDDTCRRFFQEIIIILFHFLNIFFHNKSGWDNQSVRNIKSEPEMEYVNSTQKNKIMTEKNSPSRLQKSFRILKDRVIKIRKNKKTDFLKHLYIYRDLKSLSVKDIYLHEDPNS